MSNGPSALNGTDDSVGCKDSVASAAHGLGENPRPDELADVLRSRPLCDFELPGSSGDRDGGVMEEPVHQLEEQSRRARALETGVVLGAKRKQSGRAPLRRVEMKQMLHDHLHLTTTEVEARLKGDRTADIAAHEKVHE